jgi:uncharacterized protein
MPEIDDPPRLSTLCQSVTRDGKTVQVDIYADGDGGWLLEVVDQHGNSTVWNDSFSTDREALDVVLTTIDEEGIDALIGAPPDQLSTALTQPLSESELSELDNFLSSVANQEDAMDLYTLEGFLTAVAIGPNFVATSDWLPWVWDPHGGEFAANSPSTDQFSHIVSLVLRHYNSIVHAFSTNPTSFEPLFVHGHRWRAADWCEGFFNGFMFYDEAWDILSLEQPTWFKPFLLLAAEAEGAGPIPEEAESLMSQIAPALANIHAHWQSKLGQYPAGLFNNDFDDGGSMFNTPVIRDGPKIGRNDPCPCDSGKKFKKCCGANAATQSLH